MTRRHTSSTNDTPPAPRHRRVRRRLAPIAAALAAAGMLGGCATQPDTIATPRVAHGCETTACPPDWEQVTCEAPEPTLLVIALHPAPTARSIRYETTFAAELLRAAATPSTTIVVQAPLGPTGGYGNLLQVTVPGPAPVFLSPPPPRPNNDSGNAQARYRQALTARDAAGREACATALQTARTDAADAVQAAVGRLKSARDVIGVDPARGPSLERMLQRADQAAGVRDGERLIGVITGLDLDAVIPPPGLYPALEGSDWTVVTTGASSAGLDRVRRERIEHLLRSVGAGATVVEEGTLSPNGIIAGLHDRSSTPR